MSSQHVDRSTAEKPRPAPRTGSRLPLLALCLGFFMIMMDATVVNTALPVIGQDLTATVSGLQWVTAGYTLVFACLLLSAGSLGDRLGSRRVFLAGLAVFTIASLVCGLAPRLPVLIGARVVQGAGAALALPTSLALINASYPDREQRARAIGVWGGLGGVAAGLGPVLGGVLTNWVGWPARWTPVPPRSTPTWSTRPTSTSCSSGGCAPSSYYPSRTPRPGASRSAACAPSYATST
ncbi:MFS transporter [Amycolatopsis acidiphila]|uniref:MFS transporter n=1 Tax=Amycolatopsis acidiphila TaxID=715473 RepID=A0A558AHV4_9PSEU|nr:MFS transporter [Amycolatopsis acidiphila]TVT23819.1 MFS transporter [Amycolatopsis acidiphila]GHG97862.1 hypothetical protein GCM10017788_77600 [Amycolatopsis acidiphila]